MKRKNFFVELIICIVVRLSSVDANCIFPSEISDVWYSAHKGPLTFNTTHLTGYPIHMSVAVQSLDFECLENDGDTYLLRSTETAFIFGNDIRGYLCLEFHRISEFKYYYFLGTIEDPTNNDNIYGVVDGTTVAMSAACNRAKPYDDSTYIILVKDGAPTSGMGEATCSGPLLAKYGSVTITDASGTSCSGTTFDGCSVRTGQDYTYDAGCNTIPFSSSGSFVCMRTVYTGGYYYLSVWNNDTTVASGDYQFSCMVISLSGSTTYATESPNYCGDTTQTSSALPAGASEGNIYVFTSQIENCENIVEGQSNIVYYLTIVIGSLAIIFAVFLIVFLLKTKGCPKCCCPPCSCCRCPSFTCCMCRSNKVTDSRESLDTASSDFTQEDGRPDEVANTIFRLPPIESFKPKKPIVNGPVVEAYLMPLPKVEPLYAKLPEPRTQRTYSVVSLGSVFSFKFKF